MASTQFNMFDLLNDDTFIKESTIAKIKKSKNAHTKSSSKKEETPRYKLYVVSNDVDDTDIETVIDNYNVPFSMSLSVFKSAVLASDDTADEMGNDGLGVTDYTPKRADDRNPHVMFIHCPELEDGGLLPAKMAKMIISEHLKCIKSVNIITDYSLNIHVTRSEQVMLRFEKFVDVDTCLLVHDILRLMTWSSEDYDVLPGQTISVSLAHINKKE